MSIFVVCPSCHSRFNVNDKFAGRTGSCPKCKGPIEIPALDQQVKVHTPDAFSGGGRSATTGKLITKPIARMQATLNPVVAVAICGTTLVVLLLAWLGGSTIQSSIAVRAIGLLLISPPLVMAAYAVLRDDDLEPYEGRALYLRVTICALAYVALWGVFTYLSGRVDTSQPWNWLFVAPPLLISGALAALASLDLDFGNSCLHYAFYVLVTALLRWVAGMGWLWENINYPAG